MNNKVIEKDQQTINEQAFYKGNIDKRLLEGFRTSNFMKYKIKQGVSLLTSWLNKGEYYPKKQERVNQLKQLDIEKLVEKVLLTTIYCFRDELLVSVAVQLVSVLKFDDKPDGVKTAAELLGVLCQTDLYDVNKDTRDRLTIISKIEIESSLKYEMGLAMNMPPMVCKPKSIKNNHTSGYLTFNDSVVLGKDNNHGGNLCLEVLDSLNKTPLNLNLEFLKQVNEEIDEEKIKQKISEAKTRKEVRKLENQLYNWEEFREQSKQVYLLLAKQGNKFYMTHKVDMRGRIYAQGYHVNYQGMSYKKSSIELANKEIVSGL